MNSNALKLTMWINLIALRLLTNWLYSDCSESAFPAVTHSVLQNLLSCLILP